MRIGKRREMQEAATLVVSLRQESVEIEHQFAENNCLSHYMTNCHR